MQQLLSERNVGQAISLVPEEDPLVLANAIISLYASYNSVDPQTLSTLYRDYLSNEVLNRRIADTVDAI